jgi:hypothetical protein
MSELTPPKDPDDEIHELVGEEKAEWERARGEPFPGHVTHIPWPTFKANWPHTARLLEKGSQQCPLSP